MAANELEVDKARAVSRWYSSSVRQFLEEFAPDQVAALDDEARRLSAQLDSSPETAVCLVGVSGIGKSTLINAIVADDKTVAPAGGVGPLTALATEVRFSASPRLKAEYHPKHHLWRVASALNFQIARARKERLPPDVPELGLDEGEREEIAEETKEGLEPENEGAQKRMEDFMRMARLMVTGSQHEQRAVEYLADALTLACSAKPRWGTTLSAEDCRRIDDIKLALRMAEAKEALVREQEGDARGFRETLRDHAAGFLSPLIQRIEVGWPSDALKSGLVLVDLPGVGIAGDVYKKETQRFVRERARAVVLVVDRAGPTESVMDLLRSTGYWDRLLASSDDPEADPCSLLLAVTRVDDLATQDWYDIDPDEEGRRARSKAEVFDELRQKLLRGLRQQFEQQIASFVVTEGSVDIQRGREAASEKILRSLEIHPVSAIEYRRLLAANDDDRAFLRSVEQSGLPQLAASLKGLADTQAARRIDRLRALTGRLFEGLTNKLDTVEATWKSNRSAEEAERVRNALQKVLDEKGPELTSRRASFRTFLRQTVPEKIKVAVHEAKDVAQKDINRYLRGLQDAHWATLRAAVQRGGTFYGARHINLPSDIALRFQDPVAAAWSQALLKTIRQETYNLARDTRAIVEELCDWASREQNAYIDAKVIETQKAMVSGQVERLREVGKEKIEDLREVVKVKVVEAIEKPIRSACKDFVERGNDVGPGVKSRILNLFRELAESSTDAAGRPTEKTLLEQYGRVKEEIDKAFRDWGNPLESAADGIVERHGDRVKRSDSQKRVRVLQTLSQLRADSPQLETA